MYTVENEKYPTQRDKAAKADKGFFQWLLVAKDAGRWIDLKTLSAL